LIIILAGLNFVLIGFFTNYGFEKVEAIIANNILILDSVFGIILGFLLYQEIPTIRELIGGIIIVISAVLMNIIKTKRRN
jgi:drug/metabolite transporter (DMT)-like permease